MEAVRRLRDVMILTVFVLSIFALVGLQLYQGSLLLRSVDIRARWTAALSGIASSQVRHRTLRAPERFRVHRLQRELQYAVSSFE